MVHTYSWLWDVHKHVYTCLHLAQKQSHLLFFLDGKSKTSPRTNLKFRFDKLSHSTVSIVSLNNLNIDRAYFDNGFKVCCFMVDQIINKGDVEMITGNATLVFEVQVHLLS